VKLQLKLFAHQVEVGIKRRQILCGDFHIDAKPQLLLCVQNFVVITAIDDVFESAEVDVSVVRTPAPHTAADLQVPRDILRATIVCTSTADSSGRSAATMRSVILRADRHIPQAICNRSASVFAASTRAISGWITSAAESLAGSRLVIPIPSSSDSLHWFIVRLEDFTSGV
jgi:hypothetical protein